MKKKILFALSVLPMMLTGRNVDAKVISMGEFKLTAYCSCEICSEQYGTQTASGMECEVGNTVAADLSYFNLGDTITINGVEYTVMDTCGAVKGEVIDIYMDTHADTERFGVQYGDVDIIRED